MPTTQSNAHNATMLKEKLAYNVENLRSITGGRMGEMQGKHLDDGVAGLKLVPFQLKVSKQPQGWGMANLDRALRVIGWY